MPVFEVREIFVSWGAPVGSTTCSRMHIPRASLTGVHHDGRVTCTVRVVAIFIWRLTLKALYISANSFFIQLTKGTLNLICHGSFSQLLCNTNSYARDWDVLFQRRNLCSQDVVRRNMLSLSEGASMHSLRANIL